MVEKHYLKSGRMEIKIYIRFRGVIGGAESQSRIRGNPIESQTLEAVYVVVSERCLLIAD